MVFLSSFALCHFAVHLIPLIRPNFSMTQTLESFINKVISVITGDGRNIVGLMKGFDQTINLVLEDSHERVFSEDAGVEQIPLGLYIVRGDNVLVLINIYGKNYLCERYIIVTVIKLMKNQEMHI